VAATFGRRPEIAAITPSRLVRDDGVFNSNHSALCELGRRDNTHVPNDSFTEYMPIKKVAMQPPTPETACLTLSFNSVRTP
jgi:hypothetical protein